MTAVPAKVFIFHDIKHAYLHSNDVFVLDTEQ